LISIEELKQHYPNIIDVKPHGPCIVVPEDMFNPDWEFQLEDQGYKVHLVELDRRVVALVSLTKKSGESSEKLVFTPPPKSTVEKISPGPEPVKTEATAKHRPGAKKGIVTIHWTHEENEKLLYEWPRTKGTTRGKAIALVPLFPGRNAKAINLHYYAIMRSPRSTGEPRRKGTGRWPDEDIEKLISLWKGPMTKSEIEKSFPTRTPKSVRMVLTRLKKAGKIEKRKSGPRGKTRQPLKELHVSSKPEKVFMPSKEEVEKVMQPLETTSTTPSELKRLTLILDSLVTVVDKLGCQAIMQALEIKELKNQDFKIPFVIWDAYADALLEEDKENRDRFRERTRKLLEAQE
jgi:hypothetical protein